jgi:hypothetical protein
MAPGDEDHVVAVLEEASTDHASDGPRSVDDVAHGSPASHIATLWNALCRFGVSRSVCSEGRDKGDGFDDRKYRHIE